MLRYNHRGEAVATAAPHATVVVPLPTESQKNIRKEHSQGEYQAQKRSVLDLEVELQLHLHPTFQRPGASTPGWLVAFHTRPAYLRKLLHSAASANEPWQRFQVVSLSS